MKNSRFWTGLALLMTPPMAIAFAVLARLLAPSPVIEGTVMYHGNPLRGGIISFVSQDRERSLDMVGLIDYNGRFVCHPEWSAYESGRARFEIRIVPDPRARRSRRLPSDAAANSVDNAMATTQLERHGEPSPTPTVTLASFASPDVRSPDVFGRPGAERRSGDDAPRPLEISLAYEAVCLDIDLTD
jgi:hypothetical protein